MSVSVWGLRGSESQQTDRDIHVNVSQAENEQLLRSMSVSSLPACTVVELCHYVCIAHGDRVSLSIVV